jgi:hypothetical protein
MYIPLASQDSKMLKELALEKTNFNGEGPCVKFFDPNLCSKRRQYLFWGFFHPTAFASELAALTLYGGGPRFVKPMNFSQLAMVDA